MKKVFIILIIIILLCFNLYAENRVKIEDYEIDKTENLILINEIDKIDIEEGIKVFLYENNKKIGYFNVLEKKGNKSVCKVSSLVIDKLNNNAQFYVFPEEFNFDKGIYFFENKNFSRAIDNFEKNLEINPNHYPSMFNLGISYFALKQYDKSKKYVDRALNRNPFNLKILKLSALLDFVLYNEQTFLEKSKRILSLDVMEKDIKLLTSIIFSKYKKFVMSNNMLNIPGTENDILKSINLIYLTNYKKAVQILKSITDIPNENLKKDINALIGICYYKTENKDKAAEYLQKYSETFEINPMNIEILLNNINANFKSFIVQKIIMENVQKTEPLIKQESVISQLMLKQKQLQEELAARRKEIEIQSKNYSASKFKTTTIYERKDKSTGTTNPVPGANLNFKMDYSNKIGDYKLKSSIKYFRNRWDGLTFDEFKTSISHDNFSLDFGKVSTKNFPELVKHPSLEYGVSGEIKIDKLIKSSNEKKSIYNDKYTISDLYMKKKSQRKYFLDNTISFGAGVSKEHIGINEKKEENEGSYESGQLMQYTLAMNYRTNVTKNFELGLTSAYTEDENDSGIINDALANPIRNTVFGLDGSIKLKSNLILDFEQGWSYYDENRIDTQSSISDISNQFELKYKLDFNDLLLSEKSYLGSIIKKWTDNNSVDLNAKIKTISGNWYVEGGDQGTDGGKRTWTYTMRYTKNKELLYRLNAIDFKYERWKNNLDGSNDAPKKGFTSKTTVKTLFPYNINYEFSYQIDNEWCFDNCSDKDEKIYDHILNFDIKPIFSKFVLNYNFDIKDDMSASPTDEKKKFYGLAVSNQLIKELPVKISWQLEHKYYDEEASSSEDYNYRDMKISFETKYKYTNKLSNNFDYSYNKKQFSDAGATGHETKRVSEFGYSLNYDYSSDLKVMAKYEYTDEEYTPTTASEYTENNYKIEVKYNF